MSAVKTMRWVLWRDATSLGYGSRPGFADENMSPLIRTAYEILPRGRDTDHFRQAANEFLAYLIREADRSRCFSFTSDQAAAWLSYRGYPRRYVQKMLSRLRKKGLLFRYKGPRPVRGACNRGVRNFYVIIPRGRDRALWWSKRHSPLGIHYLTSGMGNPKEYMSAMSLRILSRSIPYGPDTWRFRSRDLHSIGYLLANLSNDFAYFFSFRGHDALHWIHRLKYRGLVPDYISPPMFEYISKKFYHQSDTSILIAVLYRSVVHWKGRYEILEQKLERGERESDVVTLKHEVANLSSELALATQRRENTEVRKLLAEQRATNHELQFANESRKGTLRNVFDYLGYVSDSLNDLTDPILIPMKMHMQYSLWIARLFLTAFP